MTSISWRCDWDATLERMHHARIGFAPDLERYATAVAAFIRLAMIRLMPRRLTKRTLCP
jgi:hypothetical protein